MIVQTNEDIVTSSTLHCSMFEVVLNPELWVLDRGGNRIRRMMLPDGDVKDFVFDKSKLPRITDITYTPNNFIYISSWRYVGTSRTFEQFCMAKVYTCYNIIKA